MGHGNVDQAFALPRVGFVVLAKSPETVEPTKGAFYYPTFRE
jgi:hypothetical protein